MRGNGGRKGPKEKKNQKSSKKKEEKEEEESPAVEVESTLEWMSVCYECVTTREREKKKNKCSWGWDQRNRWDDPRSISAPFDWGPAVYRSASAAAASRRRSTAAAADDVTAGSVARGNGLPCLVDV